MTKKEKSYNKNIKELSEIYNKSSKDVQNEIINELVVKTKNVYSNSLMPNFIAKNLFSIKPLNSPKIQIAEAPCFNNGDEQFASIFIFKLINIFDIIMP